MKQPLLTPFTQCAATFALLLFTLPDLLAADLYWDANGNTTTATGGSGTWSTANTWRNGSSTGTLQGWADGNNAVFGGTVGTLTISTTPGVNQMKFLTAGYSIGVSTSPGTGPVSFTGSYGDSTPAIDSSGLAAGSSTTFNSKISGTISGGLVIKDANIITSGGRIYLNNASGNDFSGDITMLSGSLHVFSAFGNAANKIILKGGGLYGNSGTANTTYNVNRDLAISANSYIYNNSGSANQVMDMASGKTITGTANLSVTNGGANFATAEVRFSGDMSGFSGTIFNLAGIMTIQSMATSAGGWVVNAGTLKLNTASSDTAIANGAGKPNLVVNGGTLNLNGKSETINGLAGNSGNVQNDLASSASTLTLGDGDATAGFGGAIKDNGGTGGTVAVTKIGSGTQTLTGANTYSGATTISAGTLALGVGGSLNAASSVSIASGATLDVSAISYTLGSSASLTASGTATTPAAIAGTASLGSRPVTLNYTPDGFAGDSDSHALSLSSGNLTINGTITVNNNAGTPLGEGTYVLIKLASGTVSGSPTLNGAIGGSGVAPGKLVSLQVAGGEVQLVVQGALATTTTLARHSGTGDSTTYGDSLSFDVQVTASSGTPTGTVELRDGGLAGALIASGSLSGGSVTLTPALNALSATTHNNLVASYLGDGSTYYASSSSALSPAQVVGQKALTISGASAQSKYYDGNTGAVIAGSLAGVVTGDSGNVTLNGTGTFDNAGPGTGINVTSSSTLGGSASGNYTLTQPSGLSADIYSTAIWSGTAVDTLWATAGNWQAGLVPDQADIIADFSTLDLTTDQTVSLGSTPRTIGGMTFGDTDTGTAAGWTVSGSTLTLAATTPTVTVNALGSGKATTISSILAGSAGLTKAGAGRLVLAAVNTYSGGTTVSGGTLQLGNGASANGVVAGNITDDAALEFANPIAQTYSGVISGSGSLTKSAAGTLTLNSTHSYSGGTTVSAGTLKLGDGTSANGAVATDVTDNAAVEFANPSAQTYSGVISGSGSLTKSAAGTLTLSGANHYAGNSTIAAGVVNLGVAEITGVSGPLGSSTAVGSIVLSGGTLQYSAANQHDYSGRFSTAASQAYKVDTAGQNVTWATALTSSGGSLTKTGSGSLALTGVNTFSGTATCSGGMVDFNGGSWANNGTSTTRMLAANNGGTNRISNSGSVTLAGWGDVGYLNDTGNGTLILDSGTLTINGKAGGTAPLDDRGLVIGEYAGTTGWFEMNGGTLTVANTVYLGQASGSAVVSGTWDLKGGAASIKKLQFAYSSGASGTLNLSGGTLTIGSSGITKASGTATLNLSGGTLAASAVWSSSLPMTLTGAGPSVDTTGGNITLSGVLSGNGALSKTGTGTLTLGASDNYSGNTTIGNGTLALTGSGNVTASPVIHVQSSGIFDVSGRTGGFALASGMTLKGSGSVLGTVTVNGTIAPGASIGTLSTGNETWAGGGSYEFEINDATGTAGTGLGWDLLTITGNLNLTATSGSKFTITNISLGGAIANFDPAKHYGWKLATVTGTITGFDEYAFAVDTSGFANSFSGQFKVNTNGNAIYLYYQPACGDTTLGHAVVSGNQEMYFTNTTGIKNVQGITTTNCTISGTAYNIADQVIATGLTVVTNARTDLPPGTTRLLLVATKVEGGQYAWVNAMVKNYCDTAKQFDPVITTLEVLAGNKVTQRFEGILSAEHYLFVKNGTPGLRRVEINLNGRQFAVNLTGGQTVSSDLRSAMREGTDNVVILTGYGDVGSSALVTLTDTATGNEQPLEETVTLTLNRTANGLQLSWPDTLEGWSLESSATASGDWAAVSTAPASADGQLTVTVHATGGAQFYRLHAPAARSAAAGDAKLSSTTLPATNATTNPTLKHSYEGLLW